MIEVFNTFSQAPLDVPGIDHDDRTPPRERVKANVVARGLYAVREPVPATYGIVVPYPGVWHEHDRGDPVYGIKRIVHRMTGTLATLWAAPDDQKRLWGEFFTRKLERAQRRAGLRVTGVWDVATHKKFAPWADQYAIELLQHAVTAEEKQRRAVLAYLMAFYNRRWQIPYSQLRPTELVPAKRVRRSDCSGSVAQAMASVGALPKVDWRWTNTDTQILFGVPVFRLDRIAVADVPLYGRGDDPSHEACIVDTGDSNGRGARVFSFGHFPAKILPIDYRPDRIAIRRFI